MSVDGARHTVPVCTDRAHDDESTNDEDLMAHQRRSSGSVRINVPPVSPKFYRDGREVTSRRRRRVALGSLALLATLTLLLWPSSAKPEQRRTTATELKQEARPTVQRTVLDRLRLLEHHYGADDEDEARYRAQGTGVTVAQIPEPSKQQAVEVANPGELVATDAIDAQFGGHKFLLPAWVGEQETKAQLHIHQLGLLARQLNRTLVLPNVSKSRMGTCYAFPFPFYYDIDALDLGVATITQADFLDWVEHREHAPTAQVVNVAGGNVDYPKGAIEIDSSSDPASVPGRPARNLCLRKTRLVFDHSPLVVYTPEGYHRTELSRTRFGDSLLATLSNPSVAQKSQRQGDGAPDVLALNYELRFATIDPAVVGAPAFAHFSYAQVWTQVGNAVADALSPFVAVHWRTETLAEAHLPPCADALLDKLALVRRAYPAVTTLYLATDYPIEDLDPSLGSAGAAHSGTFAKSVTEGHHVAFRRFLERFAERVPGMRLTTFAKEQSSIDIPEALHAALEKARADDDGEDVTLADLDPGLLGIVDKVVAMRAELFLTGRAAPKPGAMGVCAKASSFSQQIVDARAALLGDIDRNDVLDDLTAGVLTPGDLAPLRPTPGVLWNAVHHWSLPAEPRG